MYTSVVSRDSGDKPASADFINNHMEITSTRQIIKSGWIFKASESDEGIVIVAFNPAFEYSTVKFFTTPEKAKDWVDNLCIQSKEMLK